MAQPEMVVQSDMTAAPVVETAYVQEPVMQAAPVEPVMAQPEMVVQPEMTAAPVVETAYVQEPAMQAAPVEPVMAQPEMVVQSPGFTNAPASEEISANSIQFFPADNFNNDPMSQALFMQQQNVNNAPQVGAVKKGIILVVDDSPLVSNFVKKIFSSNYDVLIASDGQKAIDIINDESVRKQIKTCLLDLNMPNVSGFDVMDYFKEKGFFVRTPVAIISGAEDAESLEKAKGYPIVDVLPKPFNERDVQRVVEKCLAVYF
jgi:CheY-like chemotaxis protein